MTFCTKRFKYIS